MHGTPHEIMSGQLAGDYAPDKEIPLAGYATLSAMYLIGAVAVVTADRRVNGGRAHRMGWSDIALLGLACHKASRLLAKDKVTAFLRAPFTRYQKSLEASEVMEEPRGHGFRLALGTLVACPFCVGMWVAGGLVAGHTLAPRVTRLASSTLAVLAISDYLQYGWTAAQTATTKFGES